MNNMIKQLKRFVETIPYGIGKWLARMPFSWRLGREYARAKAECAAAKAWSDGEVELYAVRAFNLKENTASWRIRMAKSFIRT